MKKNIYTLIMFILGISIIQAKPVTPTAAKNLAISFYKQNSNKVPQTVTLAYTETSTTGEAVYYVFNINSNDGFVIVTAEDAARPILGYSTEKKYIVPLETTTIAHWMKNRAKEILSIRAANIQATEAITKEWNGNFNTNSTNNRLANGAASTASTMSVAPLVKTTWDQSPYYNAMCPGTGNNQAVTGCVATAMAQIMRFWNYPAHGTGSSSYCDCTANGFTTQNGTLTANYGATTYSWTAMPLNVSSANTAVATLMYQCGVSVDMDYAASGSGAWVIASDNAICAQTSYTNYFSYDPTTIKGLDKSNYADTAWTTLLENELNIGRPIQYVGDDATQGGHTWVCDGYDANNFFHMNWGWSGLDDAFYALTNLTTTGNFNPIQDQEALIGIKPLATYSVDAGISSVVSPTGSSCTSTFIPVVTLKNFGANTLTSCTINYNIDNGANQTYSWTGSLANGLSVNVTLPSITTTAGTHTLTSSTSNPNATTDNNTTNDQSINTFVSNTSAATLPLVEGFESSANLPNGWTLNNPDGDAAWQIVTTVAHTGTNCIGFNNFDGDQTTDMTGRKDWFYTTTYNFSSANSATLNFDVAYAVLNYSGTLYTDTLAVQYSTDCGTTWNQIYKKGGATLASAPTTTNSSTGWTPSSSSQWRTDNVTLPAGVLGQASVMFAFENISDWADWLYIDNINITTNATAGISTNNVLSSVSVYPNPAHNSISVNMLENTSSISVTDIIGQTVIAEQKTNGAQQVQNIDITNLANGVYFMKVNSTDNQTKIIRFIKD